MSRRKKSKSYLNMTARGRTAGSTDWDPMRDDYNNTSYDAQYQDNDISGRSASTLQLDHRKLYITNIPAGLNEQGLRTAFEKYGQVEQAYLSKDPTKKYALIRYETAAEARIAMMKLNKTEPLNLNINVAHARAGASTKDGQNSNGFRERGRRDSGSYVSNRSRNQDEQANYDMDSFGDTMGMSIDHNLHIELEAIKLEKLRLQEEKLNCRQKLMLLKMAEKRPMSKATTSPSQHGAAPAQQTSSKRLLRDGHVIVLEKQPEPESTYAAGAGDSLNLPGLQCEGARACLVCGATSDMYCARCGVTPYCSVQCQSKDWQTRHRAVCHNLTRLKAAGVATVPARDNDAEEVMPAPAPAPLRRPHSPPARSPQPRAPTTNNKARFVPPNHQAQPAPRTNQRTPPNRTNQNGRRPQQHLAQNNNQDDEEWGNDNKTANPPTETKTPTKDTVVEAPQTKAPVVPKTPVLTETKRETPTPMLPNKPKALMEVDSSPAKPRQPQNEVAIVPSHYLVEKLPCGERVILTTDRAVGRRLVCVALHADYEPQYTSLFGDICADQLSYTPHAGAVFAYYNRAEEAWYRARALSARHAALLDVGKLVQLTPGDKCTRLAAQFNDIPEFCCTLEANAELGVSLHATILMKTSEGIRVSIEVLGEDTYLGEGVVTRWRPEEELPDAAPAPAQTRAEPGPAQPAQAEPKTEAKPSTAQAEKREITTQPQAVKPAVKIPEVPRLPIVNKGRYFLVHVTSLGRACVRPADVQSIALYDAAIQQTALVGLKQATPQLKATPACGTLVISKYVDDMFYRAIVKRTKASDNKYKIEFVDYANEEIVTLDKLYACPSELELSVLPTQASIVQLSTIDTPQLTPPAEAYIGSVIDEEVELIASIPGGAESVPSGSLVQFNFASNMDSLNKKLEHLCTPEWKRLQDGGGDVIESPCVLYPHVRVLPLPARSFVLEVTDFGSLEAGLLSGYEKGNPMADYVYGPLTDKINAYAASDLCAEPYVPMVEEMCIAKLPPYPQWFRAVVLEHAAGAPAAVLLYVDYGSVEAHVPVAHVRKCLPEFAADPTLAATVEVRDWPKPITTDQIRRAIEYLKINETTGRGELFVTKATRVEDSYIIDAPQLIAAINGE